MQRATLTFCSCSAPCPLQREREVEGARDDRKRGYNSLAGQEVDVTPEEMEAYRLKKSRGADDPLTFINKSKEEAGGGGGYDYV